MYRLQTETVSSTEYKQGELNTRRGNRVSMHFAVTFLDCWRTSFCVTTIIKIVNNNTNDKQTFSASLALAEDSPYSLMFVYIRSAAFIIVVTQKHSSPEVQKRHSKMYGNPIAPSLYSILLGLAYSISILVNSCKYTVQLTEHTSRELSSPLVNIDYHSLYKQGKT